MVGNTRVSTNEETGTKWHVKDHLQSTSITLDDSGNLLEALRYAPYGSERDRMGDYTSIHTYTDQVSDRESELMYYGSRYYDPSLRTFTSPDTVAILQTDQVLTDPQLQNPYSYVANNPVKYVDPSGEIVELGAKRTEALPIAAHTYVQISAPQGGNLSHLGLSNYDRITLGGYNAGKANAFIGNLDKGFNQGSDYYVSDETYIGSIEIQKPDRFKKQEDFERSIFNTFMGLETDQGAYSLGSIGQPNSNNFASHLLLSNGVPSSEIKQIRHKFPSDVFLSPGIGQSLPSQTRSSLLDQLNQLESALRTLSSLLSN